MIHSEPVVAPSVEAFGENVLPRLRRGVEGKRMAEFVGGLVEEERFNSFDRFHKADGYIAQAYKKAEAGVEVWKAPTGGMPGNGKWVIQEAMDVRGATLDLIEPVQKRVADWAENPWHVVQWTAATPREGIVGEIVIVDTEEDFQRLRGKGLKGKLVLTQMETGPNRVRFCAGGAVGMICDKEVEGCPDAVGWRKFGWGGLPVQDAAARLVGMVLSANQGKELRQMLAGGGKVRAKIWVDGQRYTGTHDVVSGIIRGRDDPQSEIWAVAHSHEPGALDNASGVAVCVEIARVLQGLIATGILPRPRRSIRLLSGYECYGFFHYLEHGRRFETPLAGFCLDTVGARPEVCQTPARLALHRTVTASAGFVDDVAEYFLRAAMKIDDAGYQLAVEEFRSTDDTLLGDPRYGFPCPWVTNHPCVGYHSSADRVEMLHPVGLELCAAATAAYLYYLADAATPEALEWMRWQTRGTVQRLRRAGTTGAEARFAVARHGENIQRMQRWLWGGKHAEILEVVEECRGEVKRAGESGEGSGAARSTAVPRREEEGGGEMRYIPIRRALLAPSMENVYPPMTEALKLLPKWAHYWADGNRTLAQIKELLEIETQKPVAEEALSAYFRALEEIGFVELLDSRQMLGGEELVRDLRALGLRPGMDVMVHSSLSSLGEIRGGAATVVEALLAAISPGGTLLAPTFNHMWAEVFNPLTTRSTDGAIPNAFWRRGDALRSMQPTHSVAAIGPKAAHYTAGHLEAGIWGPDSPIGRLIAEGGYVLSLGVSHNSTTVYHLAEISLKVPCLNSTGDVGCVVEENGQVRSVRNLAWRSGRCPVDPTGIGAILDQKGQQAHGHVGRAEATLAKAVDVFNARKEQLGNTCLTCMIRPHQKTMRGTLV